MKDQLKNICRLCKSLGLLFLLILFLFNTLGYYLIFFISQDQYRANRFEFLKNLAAEENATVLKFSIKDKAKKPYRRVKDGEIVFEGKLYDIAKEEIKNDSIYFFVYQDEEEEEMLAELEEHIETHATENAQNKLPEKGAKPDVLKNLIKDYFPSGLGIVFYPQSFDFKFGEIPDFHLSAIISTPDNPPEVFKV